MAQKRAEKPQRQRKPPFKRVEVQWADAYSVDSWTSVADLQGMIDKKPEYEDHATGYVVAENAQWVVLANSLSYDAAEGCWQAAATMVIPRGMVLREVKPGRTVRSVPAVKP